ncbi:MAG: hypothetical protein KUA33_09025, partial [Methanobacterium sp.]|nr:hypothetical protein [Euryarchaeota archaeon]MBV1730348.1 hypothetical protein [Methanobacterium sp.]
MVTFIKKELNGQLNAVIVNYINGNLEISPIYDISGEALKDDDYARTIASVFSGRDSGNLFSQQDYYIISLANQWAIQTPLQLSNIRCRWRMSRIRLISGIFDSQLCI